jgi:hypothetical protein
MLAGVLVVNVTWRGKTYVGTLMDSTKHDWAPPRWVHMTGACNFSPKETNYDDTGCLKTIPCNAAGDQVRSKKLH